MYLEIINVYIFILSFLINSFPIVVL